MPDKSRFKLDGNAGADETGFDACGTLWAKRALVAFPAVPVISMGISRVCRLRGADAMSSSVDGRFIGTVEAVVAGWALGTTEPSVTSGDDGSLFSENREPAESLSSRLSLLRFTEVLCFCGGG